MAILYSIRLSLKFYIFDSYKYFISYNNEMKYFIENNLFYIKYTNTNFYKYYCKIFDLYGLKYNKNNKKNSILLDISDYTFIENITDKLQLFQIFFDFNIKLKKINIYISEIVYQDLIIFKHKLHKYLILGCNLSEINKNNFYLDNLRLNLSQPISVQIKYLIFIRKVTKTILDKITSLFYKFQLTIICNECVDTSLPIYNINLSSTKFLNSVFTFLSNNKDILLYSDIIVIFDNDFFENIFQHDFINSLENILIIGNLSEKTILDKDFHNIINNVKNVKRTNIYKDYTQIILSSTYLDKMLVKIIDKNIEELSIICNNSD